MKREGRVTSFFLVVFGSCHLVTSD